MGSGGVTFPALSFWPGRTVHARTKPFTHRFGYRIAYIGLDLDRLEEAAATSRWFSVGKFNLFSFHPGDHGARDGSDLRDWALKRFAEVGVELDGGSIRLVCQPRVLGYQFNPISVWLGYGPDGALRGALYEVHNTFGDAHTYGVRIRSDEDLHHRATKSFHVSPFFGVEGQYGFSLKPGDDRLGLSIVKSVSGETDFTASMTLIRQEATSSALWKLFLRQPFSTHKTIAAIHFEALKLWLKGARYHPRPTPPSRPLTSARFGTGSVSE